MSTTVSRPVSHHSLTPRTLEYEDSPLGLHHERPRDRPYVPICAVVCTWGQGDDALWCLLRIRARPAGDAGGCWWLITEQMVFGGQPFGSGVPSTRSHTASSMSIGSICPDGSIRYMNSPKTGDVVASSSHEPLLPLTSIGAPGPTGNPVSINIDPSLIRNVGPVQRIPALVHGCAQRSPRANRHRDSAISRGNTASERRRTVRERTTFWYSNYEIASEDFSDGPDQVGVVVGGFLCRSISRHSGSLQRGQDTVEPGPAVDASVQVGAGHGDDAQRSKSTRCQETDPENSLPLPRTRDAHGSGTTESPAIAEGSCRLSPWS